MKSTLKLYALRLTVAALVSFAQSLSAQTNYHVYRESGAFTPLVGATVIEFDESDDAISAVIDLPFAFEYFGVDRYAFRVSTNGFITFDTTATDHRMDNSIGSCDEPIVAPLWDDLGGGSTGVVSHQVEGSAPNRIFTIEYLNWHWPYNVLDPNMSFQIKFLEAGNVVQFVYRVEAEKTAYATASIGIMEQQAGRFYAMYSQYGTLINYAADENTIQPESGDMYTFSPSAPAEEPTVQPSGLMVTDITENSATLHWTRGNGKFELVAIRESPEDESQAPIVDGELYDFNEQIGDGWKHELTLPDYFPDTHNSTYDLNLKAGFTYQVQVFGFNGAGGFQNYNTSVSGENSIEFTVPNLRPSYNATAGILHHGTTTVRFSMEGGDGESQALFLKAENMDVLPEIPDSVFYGAGDFQDGDQIGNTGWYCVFRGRTNFIEVEGLLAGTDFTVAVVDFNGPMNKELYLVNPEMLHFRTFTAKTASYVFTKSDAEFIELTGATAINEVEDDDKMSDALPIGFTFEYSGEPFDSLRVNSNGFVTFNLTVPRFSSHTVDRANRLTENYFSPLLAPMWDDMSGAGGGASYKTEGTAGNRVFTVEFKNWKWNYDATEPGISMQVKLYESDNRIEYRYRQESGQLNSASASIGLSFLDLNKRMTLTSAGTDAELEDQFELAVIKQKPATGQVFAFTPGPAKFDQTITFDEIGFFTYDPTHEIALHATSTSGLPITFTSSNEETMIISGDTAKIVGVGTVYITAHQVGNDLYHAAYQEVHTFVEAAKDTIYFDEIAETEYALDKAILLNATSYSGLPVFYELSNSDVVSINDNELTVKDAGTVEITARTFGNLNYYGAIVKRTLVVTKAIQTITFDELGEAPYSIEPIDLPQYSDAGLAITYHSSDTDVASVVGNTLTLNGIGTATITATANGDSRFEVAEPVMRDITVIKGNQTINFPAFDTRKSLGEIITLEAVSSELLPITYATEDDDVVMIDGNVVKVVGRGAVIITATQPGNDKYNAAEPISRTLDVKAAQTISFEIPDKTIGDEPFELSGTASSGLPLGYFIKGGTIAFTDGKVVIGAPGQATIKAVQVGDNDFDSVSVTRTFCVNPFKPVILPDNSSGIVLTAVSNDGLTWFKNEVALDVTGPLTVEASGSYTVTQTISGCTSEVSDALVITITGAELSRQHAIGFAPNPVKDAFVVEARDNSAKELSVEMYDVVGRRLESWSGRGRIECNIARYQSGNYVVHIHSTAGLTTTKLVKE